ncbi:mitochondrial import receptor subunit Tom22-domain-containing protein [Mortierella sp. GBAus27b]|nr:mitochondrial import receptor protein [Mortierella sp. GBA43]KAI8360323.1 mitochondrial import receptor subunit Tom22-domain-containing protein [Mortierella sp. GBAus27b]
MVKLEEVDIDHVEEEEYTDTDSSSVYSSDDDEDDVDNIESIMDRILALQDVISPKTRKSISDKCSSIYGWGKYSAKFLGNSAWVLTTSALLLVLPLMIELEHEQGLIEYEKMQQQGSQASLFGSRRLLSQPAGQQQQKKQASGIVPPGF